MNSPCDAQNLIREVAHDCVSDRQYRKEPVQVPGSAARTLCGGAYTPKQGWDTFLDVDAEPA